MNFWELISISIAMAIFSLRQARKAKRLADEVRHLKLPAGSYTITGPVCRGNNNDAPCLYPGEFPIGCLARGRR